VLPAHVDSRLVQLGEAGHATACDSTTATNVTVTRHGVNGTASVRNVKTTAHILHILRRRAAQ